MSPEPPRAVYLIAHLRVPDVEAYQREYGRKVMHQLSAAGARLLVASPSPTVLEGEWQATWTAVIQFPDRETALRWYRSRDYAPLKKLRIEELTEGGPVVLFDAFPPPEGNG